MSKRCYFIGVPGGNGAVTSHFKGLGEELARRGNSVKILVPHGVGTQESSGANPEFLSWPSVRPTKFADALFLARLIRCHRPDCLIANFAAVNWMLLIGWLYRVQYRIALYHTMTSAITIDAEGGQILLTKRLRLRKRLVYKLATHLVASSAAARQDAQVTYGIKMEKCTAQTLGLADPVACLPLTPTAKRENLVVCAGALVPNKGQDVLIHAVALGAQSLRPNRTLFLGSGPQLGYLQQLTVEMGVADRCDFAGPVSRAEVLKQMSRAKAVVVPSRSEAFGYVNVEAMAVGTPVIASNVGGIPEVVRDGVDGYLVPAEDPEALMGKLVNLVTDSPLRELLGRNGRQRFLDCYELSKVVVGQANWVESLGVSRSADPGKTLE